MEGWQRQLRGPNQTEILEEIAAEMDNVRLAWNWMVTHRKFADILRSRHCLWHFHEIRGSLQEGQSLFGQAVEVFQSIDGLENQQTRKAKGVRFYWHNMHTLYPSSRYEQASAFFILVWLFSVPRQISLHWPKR
jgi:hypothetical protein